MGRQSHKPGVTGSPQLYLPFPHAVIRMKGRKGRKEGKKEMKSEGKRK